MEPKLFLDVDGCLLMEQDPGGYTQFDYGGETFWYDPETPKRMQAIDVLFDIYWASHKWHDHGDVLEKLFGIDSKQPQVTYDGVQQHTGTMRPEKLEEIKRFYDGPSAIVDDKMGPAVEEWAKDKTVILIQPDPKYGIREDEYNLLMSFGELHNTKDELVKDFVEPKEEGLVLSHGEWF